MLHYFVFLRVILLSVLVRLSLPVQVIHWKYSSPKWPLMRWWGR